MPIKFDEERIRQVARVVLVRNKYAAGDTVDNTVDNIVARMKSDATQYLDTRDNPGYLSTYGYVLITYLDDDRDLCVTAAVAPSLFTEYLKD